MFGGSSFGGAAFGALPASGIATTLTISPATQSNTVGTPAVSQRHHIALSAASQANIGTGMAVGAGRARLVIGAASQGNAVGNAVAGQRHRLGLSAASQGNVAGFGDAGRPAIPSSRTVVFGGGTNRVAFAGGSNSVRF
jgi:hypothetical protein